MKTKLLPSLAALLAIGLASSLHGAGHDVLIQQRNAAGTATVTRTVGTADEAIDTPAKLRTFIGSGDVVGPASATDGAVALFDGTTGKLLKNSTASTVRTLLGLSTSDSPTFAALTAASLTSPTTSTLTLATLDSNANIVLTPHGTGLTTTSKRFRVTDSTTSSSVSTGAFVVNDHFAVGGSGTVYGDGVFNLTNTNASSSTTTGALLVAGGAGIAGTLTAAVVATPGASITSSGIFQGQYITVGNPAGSTFTRRMGTIGGTNWSASAWGATGIFAATQATTVTDSSTAASATVSLATGTSFAQPTFAATNTSVTMSDAATVYIAGAPANGTNVTITRPWALFVDAGDVRFDGALQLGNAAVSETPSATHTITVKDSTGTTYRLLAVP